MYLLSQWNTALVTTDVRVRAENGVTAHLLHHFNGLQNAYVAKQEFHRCGNQPRHYWSRAIDNAIATATVNIQPSARQNMKWQIGFFDD